MKRDDLEDEQTREIRKKKQGIFKSALVNALSKRTAEILRNDENRDGGDIAQMVSKALAEFIFQGEGGAQQNRNDSSKSRASARSIGFRDEKRATPAVNTRGGAVHDFLLHSARSHLTWYLAGDNTESTSNIPPAYPQLLHLATDSIPSPEVFRALHPTVVWLPTAAQASASQALISSLPLTQNALDRLLKDGVKENVLLDQSWRSYAKDSTTGYIEQKTAGQQ